MYKVQREIEKGGKDVVTTSRQERIREEKRREEKRREEKRENNGKTIDMQKRIFQIKLSYHIQTLTKIKCKNNKNQTSSKTINEMQYILESHHVKGRQTYEFFDIDVNAHISSDDANSNIVFFRT